eukprot:752574-Ditylum_brightwellii.AAC.1
MEVEVDMAGTTTTKDTLAEVALKKKEKIPLNIHHCWLHGVMKGPNHTSLNFQDSNERHQKEASLFIRVGGSTDGIDR